MILLSHAELVLYRALLSSPSTAEQCRREEVLGVGRKSSGPVALRANCVSVDAPKGLLAYMISVRHFTETITPLAPHPRRRTRDLRSSTF